MSYSPPGIKDTKLSEKYFLLDYELYFGLTLFQLHNYYRYQNKFFWSEYKCDNHTCKKVVSLRRSLICILWHSLTYSGPW